MYKLYINKEEFTLKIEPIGNLSIDAKKVTDIPTFFNHTYMVCTDRKALKQKALEIKNEWICEAKEVLISLNAMEIKIKY